MPIINWTAELPSSTRQKPKKRRPRFYSQMQALKGNPGVWANVINYQSRYTATNAATTFRVNGFQAAVRKAPNGWYRVFARYAP